MPNNKNKINKIESGLRKLGKVSKKLIKKKINATKDVPVIKKLIKKRKKYLNQNQLFRLIMYWRQWEIPDWWRWFQRKKKKNN